jgi:hypothetical protein
MAGDRKFMAVTIKYNEVYSRVVHVEIIRREISLNNLIIQLLFRLSSHDLMEHLRTFSGPLVPMFIYETLVALLKHGWNAVE